MRIEILFWIISLIHGKLLRLPGDKVAEAWFDKTQLG